jgi:HEAT repeat protein
MPLLSILVLSALVGILGGMFVFILSRRAWRSYLYGRRDRFREYWWRRLPALLAGEIPSTEELQNPEALETLESLLLHRLETAEGEERDKVAQLIERSGLLELRIRRLTQGARWERLHTAAALGQIRAPAAVPALAKALEDPWLPVRAAALRSLGMIGSPAAGPAVLRVLRQKAPAESNLWIEAAVACVPDPHDFLPLLQGPREAVRALAARAIAESPHPLHIDSLNPLAFDPDPEVRAQAMRALGRSRDWRALAVLIAGTLDEVWFVRLRALVALGEIGNPAAVQAVLRATGDPNFSVRQRAAATLAGLVSDPGEALEMLASTKDRYAVEGFLSQLARAGLLWQALPLLRSPEERVRRDAEKLLRLAVEAGYHRAVLYAVETHPEWRVRMAAARLLARARSAALEDDIRQRLATAPAARSRRLLRAVLHSWPAFDNRQEVELVAEGGTKL